MNEEKKRAVSIIKVTSEKVTNKVGTFLNRDSIGSLFGRMIGYTYEQVVSKCGNVQITQTASEKVTNMVGTFLKKDCGGFQIISVPTIQAASKKVTNMVGTFLKKECDGFQIINVQTT
ncbi:hypothetical protein [Emticicia sp. C21]|uniref:hypothetical protein n=1 Tax=Emticicia sp. C21 TaxID=2302915 RepID=UPI000E34545A|nr:hypothetical protein [Emticicia sp. C21]RFS16669.1 hypothetical protein D0T08_08275 [Emticicia sp. C21]